MSGSPLEGTISSLFSRYLYREIKGNLESQYLKQPPQVIWKRNGFWKCSSDLTCNQGQMLSSGFQGQCLSWVKVSLSRNTEMFLK